MGYSKANRTKTIYITVNYQRLGEQYVFAMPRATKRDKDRKEEIIAIGDGKIDVIDWVAGIIQEPPQGFDDFPVTQAEKRALDARQNGNSDSDKKADQVQQVEPVEPPDYSGLPEQLPSLPDRIRQYFNDSTCPELKDILEDLAGSYYQATTPSAFFRNIPFGS